MRCIPLILFLMAFILKADAQGFRPRNPLDIPVKAAGTFGELRSSHYHSGLDIKTGGKEGLPVKAVADGFICRIKVSATGFGNALYIHHPQGYTTVYGHLNSFKKEIAVLVDSIQRANESFEADFQPDSLRYTVKTGDIIGLSGNSGGSEGPHLHFEIRNRFTEEPLNPLAFGIEMQDTTSPSIFSIHTYSNDGRNWKRYNGPLTGDTVLIPFDTVGFAISSFDMDSASRLGIYGAELYLNDSLVYAYTYDRFNFNETRLVNAHIDYPWWIQSKQRLRRLYRLMNDDFTAYRNSGTGKVPVPLLGFYNVCISVHDFYGHSADKRFVVNRISHDSIPYWTESINVHGDSAFHYKGKHCSVYADAGTFYQDEMIDPVIEKIKSKTAVYPFAEGFDHSETAVHKPVAYRFRMNAKLKKFPQEKIIIAEIDKNQKLSGAIQATVKRDSAEIKVRKLAKYTLSIDTVAPVGGAIRLDRDTINGTLYLRMKVKDELTGIGQVRVFQNNIWQPAFYESRTAEIIARLQDTFPSMINITVNDPCGNALNIVSGL